MKKTFILSLLSSSLLFGANIPNSSTILKDIEKNKNIFPKEQKKLIPIKGLKNTDKKTKKDLNEKTIFIKNFKITKANSIDNKELNKLLDSYKNQYLTFSQLQEVTNKITNAYRKKGFLIARAYIPKQKMKDNTLEISVLEGNYGNFNVQNNSKVKDEVITDILNQIKLNDVLTNSSYERGMLLLNETPGLKIVKSEIKAGQEVGTSDFIIETEETPFISGYALIDNHGSRYTGKHKSTLNVSLNSPFDIGDKLIFNGAVTSGNDLKNGKISYSFPLTSNGLRAELAYNKVKYKLGKEYKTLNAYGESEVYDIGLKYPIIKSRAENLDFSLTYSNKNLIDYANGSLSSDKDIHVAKAAFDFDKITKIFGYNAQINSGLALTAGNIKTNNESSQSGRYNKIDGYVNYSIFLNPIYQLNTKLSFQKAFGNENLDGSEDMSIGGISGVKIYPDGEQSAENGYLANIEIIRKLPNIKNYNHRIGLFYDLGNVYMADNSTDTSFNRLTLQDLGVSYYANYKSYFLQSFLAYRIDNNKVTSEPEYNSRFLFQVGKVF